MIFKECRVGTSIAGIYTHLTGEKHKDESPAERRRIIVELSQIPNIIQDEAGLQEFQLPLRTIKAISVLQDPKMAGMRCRKCPYISWYRQGIQKHCCEVHR
jgi:hypothetical protein